MRILIYGMSGMIGHVIASELSSNHEVFAATTRPTWHTWGRRSQEPRSIKILTSQNLLDEQLTRQTLRRIGPDLVINCAGVVKQSSESSDRSKLRALNSQVPHVLANLVRQTDTRLVHISTDCIFDGTRGNYLDDDLPTATDDYGLSKAAGEVSQPGVITLRTSVVGRELYHKHGLFEWAISNAGKEIRGYRNVRYSGLPSNNFAEVVRLVIEDFPNLWGVWNVASSAIDKYTLLSLLNSNLSLNLAITSDEEVKLDRTLCGKRFSDVTSWVAPEWGFMMEEFSRYVRANYAN